MKEKTKSAEERLAETQAKSRVKADLDAQNIKTLASDLEDTRHAYKVRWCSLRLREYSGGDHP
jgi:hypothetical protein